MHKVLYITFWGKLRHVCHVCVLSTTAFSTSYSYGVVSTDRTWQCELAFPLSILMIRVVKLLVWHFSYAAKTQSADMFIVMIFSLYVTVPKAQDLLYVWTQVPGILCRITCRSRPFLFFSGMYLFCLSVWVESKKFLYCAAWQYH